MRCNRQALLDYAADQMDLDLISEFADHLAACSYCGSELLRIKRAGNAAAYRKRPPSAEVKPFVPSPDRKEDLVGYLREYPDPELRELTVSKADRHRVELLEAPEEATTFVELPDEETLLEEIPELPPDSNFAHDEEPKQSAANPDVIAAPHLNNDSPARVPAQEEDMEPNSNAEKTIQGGAKTVKLRSGGILTLSSTAGLFQLSAKDRDFIFGLADSMAEYERVGLAPSKTKASIKIVDHKHAPAGSSKWDSVILAALGDDEIPLNLAYDRIQGPKPSNHAVMRTIAAKMEQRGLLQRRKVGTRNVVWSRVRPAEQKTA